MHLPDIEQIRIQYSNRKLDSQDREFLTGVLHQLLSSSRLDEISEILEGVSDKEEFILFLQLQTAFLSCKNEQPAWCDDQKVRVRQN